MESSKPSRLDLPLSRWFPANLETLLVALLLLAAVVTRFWNLGAMTITFDEVNHVTPSDSLYLGRGYAYDPMSHGPLQFHMISFAYSLFGDTDFTTRIPSAVLSIISVVIIIFLFRRYLGRTGALVAGLFFIISPFMLFYGRYARNESYIVVWGLLSIYSILRYLETGETWALFLFTLANAIHFTDKTTSYMYAGQQFVFLVAYFIDRMARRGWTEKSRRRFFFLGLLVCVIFLAGAAFLYETNKPLKGLTLELAIAALAAFAIAALVWAVLNVLRDLGWAGLKSDRSLSMAVLLGTFVLPVVSAVPLLALHKTPVDYSTAGILRVAASAGALGAISIAIGLLWFGRRWLLHAALFFVPFVLFYTTFFTNPSGLLNGLVGGLSYWVNAQGTNRVYQPYFYYALIEIPIYEFLPALGTLAAAVIAIARKLWRAPSGQPFGKVDPTAPDDPAHEPVPTAALLVFWFISSLFIFSIAGEKAPWLTVHLALPLILAAGWAIGWLVESIPWGRLASWTARNYVHGIPLAFFALLAVLTWRAAYRAAYINYDYPTEFLVYAHHSPYPKSVAAEIEELSLRTTGDLNMVVAYDNNVRYPYWWYMRYYPNKIDFGDTPTRDERNAVVIVGSDDSVSKLTPVVQNNYYSFRYPRIWWQDMDFWNLDWKNIQNERAADLMSKNPGAPVPPMTVFSYFKYFWGHIKPFFTDPKVFHAIWEIWFNRDYTAWAALKNSDSYTLTNWPGTQYMYEYVRKDITNLLWPLGAPAQPLPQPVDAYAGITTTVSPDLKVGTVGAGQGQFFSPRQIALAPDGTLYVADSLNHRIQHLDSTGKVLGMWGSYADAAAGNAPGGTFNEPWGVAVAPNGSVYVSDTWNYRIQEFTADGKFIRMWGSGPSVGPQGFYGPRGIAVDSEGRVFVADTGNKRIVIYDGKGNYLGEFGSGGMGLGQLDEPVDIAIGQNGLVYVTDTWNQRVEVWSADPSGLVYTAVAEWHVEGWYGNSLENKPFLTVDAGGHVYVTDPEQCRVIEFGADGKAAHVWDGCGGGGFALPSGIAWDGTGGLWVSDAQNGALVHFQPIVH